MKSIIRSDWPFLSRQRCSLEAAIYYFTSECNLRFLVKSWRSVQFLEDDPDSTLILCFAAEGEQGRIDLIHLDGPQQDFDGVTRGWEEFYWTPWRNFLAAG